MKENLLKQHAAVKALLKIERKQIRAELLRDLNADPKLLILTIKRKDFARWLLAIKTISLAVPGRLAPAALANLKRNQPHGPAAMLTGAMRTAAESYEHY